MMSDVDPRLLARFACIMIEKLEKKLAELCIEVSVLNERPRARISGTFVASGLDVCQREMLRCYSD